MRNLKGDSERLIPSVFGVGYIGIGKYNSSNGGKITTEYNRWSGMLTRCYWEKWHVKRPTYVGCSTSSEFLNFQVFAEWCQDQIGFNMKGWHLDKDLLYRDNKQYNRDTCVFVPPQINTLLLSNNATRGEYPVGVTYHRASGTYHASLNRLGKTIHIGHHATVDHAFAAYKKVKEGIVRDVAEDYKSIIDPRVYNALMVWEVER